MAEEPGPTDSDFSIVDEQCICPSCKSPVRWARIFRHINELVYVDTFGNVESNVGLSVDSSEKFLCSSALCGEQWWDARSYLAAWKEAFEKPQAS